MHVTCRNETFEAIKGDNLGGNVMKKSITMVLGGMTVANVVDGDFHTIMDNRHPFALNFMDLYDACFYGIENSSTFERRFELVQSGQYFCYLKPSLKLVAEEV